MLCGRVDMGAYEFGIGDFDCDQVLTYRDLPGLTICNMQLGASYEPGCEALDFEYDADVDLLDYAAWQNLYGQ